MQKAVMNRVEIKGGKLGKGWKIRLKLLILARFKEKTLDCIF